MKHTIFSTLLLSTLSLMVVSCNGSKITEPEGDTLTVMSSNIRYAGQERDPFNNWSSRRDAYCAMINDQHPDVFGVQEALLEQLTYVDDHCPDYQYVGVGREDGVHDGEHMSIFYDTTRVELQQWGTYWLSETPDVPSKGWDAACYRTATWTLFKDLKYDRYFYYVNTHLDHRGVVARQKGLKTVVDRISAMNPEHYPMILTGDMNVTPDDPCLDELRTMMYDARRTASVTDNGLTWNDWGEAPQSDLPIDFVFYSGFEACDRFEAIRQPYAGHDYVSDHYPIKAALRYRPADDPYVVDVQAHRGGMGLYPEESLEAMKNSVDLGVNTLEMDLNITQDHQVVLSHDHYFHPRYSTRPDGSPVMSGDPVSFIYQMPYSEIVKWDVGQKYNSDWPEKKCIPAVKPLAREVIEAIEAYTAERGLPPMHYNIEIKSHVSEDGGVEGESWPEYHEFTDICMELLESLNLGDRLTIQCFDYRALNYINSKYPGHILSYLIEGWDTDFDEYMSRLEFTPQWLSPEHENVTPDLMCRAHERGMKVVTWTVDEPEEIHRLMLVGCEAIISNYPNVLLREVGDAQAPRK